jgi:hypothetical protein
LNSTHFPSDGSNEKDGDAIDDAAGPSAKTYPTSKDPGLIALMKQQEERIIQDQDHKTSNVYMALELVKRNVSRLPSDRDFHKLKTQWDIFYGESNDMMESAIKEMSGKLDLKVEADLKEMIAWKGRVQAEIETRQIKMETSFNTLLANFGDLHKESMGALAELSNFTKQKFQSFEDENTRLTDSLNRISDVASDSAKMLESLAERVDKMEDMVNHSNEEMRIHSEKLEVFSLDIKLTFEENKESVEELNGMIKDVKIDLAATSEELSVTQSQVINLEKDVASNSERIAEIFQLGVREMPDRFYQIEEVKLKNTNTTIQENRAHHDEELNNLQRIVKQKAIILEKMTGSVETLKSDVMAKGDDIKKLQDDMQIGFGEIRSSVSETQSSQKVIDLEIREEAKTTSNRVKVVEAIVPKVLELESQVGAMSDDSFKTKMETENSLKLLQSDVRNANQAVADSNRHQEKLISASEKKMKAPVQELNKRVEKCEEDIKVSFELTGIIKKKVEHVAMHVDDSPDALAKDRLLKVVKLCLDFEDTAVHNTGQNAYVFGENVQVKLANHAQHLAEYIANRADFACLRQLISGATIEEIMYVHDQVDILRSEMTEDFLKHMLQLVKEKSKEADPSKVVLEARKIFTHRFRRAIEMALTKFDQVQVIGNTRIGRVSVPTCVACDRPLASKGRAKREDANPAEANNSGPSKGVHFVFDPHSVFLPSLFIIYC